MLTWEKICAMAADYANSRGEPLKHAAEYLARNGYGQATFGVESVENEHCEEEGVVRCGYCGEFTPLGEDWHSTICEHCGNCVSG